MVEEYEAVSKLDLHKRERYWLEELGATLNKQMPSRSTKEWREVNKVIIVKKGKEYYKKNKVVIAEKTKEYYENNKVLIAEKGSKKYTCECGSTIRKDYKSKHEKSKKHMKFLK